MSIKLNDITNPSDYNSFVVRVFPPNIFHDHLLRENIKKCEEQNKNIKVRDNPFYLKLNTLLALYDENKHYRNNGLEEIPKTDQKKMQELNKQIIEQYEDFKETLGENDATFFNLKKLLLKVIKTFLNF